MVIEILLNKLSATSQFNLQERLINFAVSIIRLTEELPSSKSGNYITSQIIRSGSSPAANYGEAQGAESTADFLHKLKIAHKELRETYVWLQIIKKADLLETSDHLTSLINEADELLAIIYTSIRTKTQTAQNQKKPLKS